MTGTSLLPAPIKNAVKPKPSRREIVEALVQLRIAELRAENESNNKRREKLAAKIRPVVIRLLRRNAEQLVTRIDFGREKSPGIWCGTEMTLDMDYAMNGFKLELPAALRALILEHNAIPAVNYLGETGIKTIRDEIRTALENRMEKTDRVQALLASPESKRALQAMLDVFTGKDEKTIEVRA